MDIIKNYIQGQFQDSSSGQHLDKVDPSTGLICAHLPKSNELDVVHAIAAAQKAFAPWSQRTSVDRARFLNLIADEIEARHEELAEAESRDTGKPLKLAKTMDIPRAVLNFRFFASRLLHQQEMATDMDGQALNYTLRQPVGVCGLISPWNLPLYLLTWKMAPALAVGNTVVCKPSELTPTTAFLLSQICEKVGLPAGVVNVVHGQGDVTGATLVRHPGVPLISFTGGTVTGEKIQTLSAPLFKKVSLELGGKNATIILKDASLDKILPEIVRSSFLNQGEICLCGSKILVQESLYEDFISKFAQETQKLIVGDRHHPDTFIGPLISKNHLDKVQACLNQALQEGSRLIAGHEPLPFSQINKNGFYMRPSVIADLNFCSDLHQTEIFGPVVTVNSFKYPHEAVKWANNSPYGLSASVWTQNLSQAHKIARDLKVGTVWVNTWLKRDLRLPFGGMKASGLGREGGDYSLDFFTETKTVCIQF